MSRTRTTLLAALPLLLAPLLTPSGPGAAAAAPEAAPERTLRFATFNASLNRRGAGELVEDLSTPEDRQARKVAEIVQRSRPDVLLVNEFDHDDAGEAVDLFRANYLEVPQRGARPIRYPHAYAAPVNTGVPSGFDLDNSGVVGGPGDAHGFGFFPGQYGMVVYSRFPIDADAVRTFQHFTWQDMPGNLMPTDFYSDDEQAVLRLSSKSHWDLPVRIGGRTVHVLASHPTPPVFDGPEDRNGTRNHDEIRFWADYVAGGRRASYVYDDQGRRGGLRSGAFVVMGDQNSDPLDGDSVPGAVQQLLHHPRVQDPRPSSEGAVVAAKAQPGNEAHRSPAAHDTADFSEPPGNLRADYVLPGRSLRVRDSGVFWPLPGEAYAALLDASDHRLVWVDVRVSRR